jgi:hypothetical protein
MHMKQESSVSLADVLNELQDLKRDLPTKRDASGSRTWQIVLVALPIILTSVLAGLGYRAQTHLTQQIARSDQQFKSRVALGEELYKRKLMVYEKAYVRLLALRRGIADYQNTKDQRAMNKSLAALYSYYHEDAIYLSDELQSHLKGLWISAGQIGRPGGPPDSAVQPQMQSIQDIIARELRVKEFLSNAAIEAP